MKIQQLLPTTPSTLSWWHRKRDGNDRGGKKKKNNNKPRQKIKPCTQENRLHLCFWYTAYYKTPVSRNYKNSLLAPKKFAPRLLFPELRNLSSLISLSFALSLSLLLFVASVVPSFAALRQKGRKGLCGKGAETGGGGEGRDRQETRYFVGLQSEAQKPFLSVVTSQRGPPPGKWVHTRVANWWGFFVADSNTRTNRGANLSAVGTSKWHGCLFGTPKDT